MKQQLLIIPGWGGTKESWKNFISLAEKDFEVFCFDLPCFGNEPCPREIWGIDEYADFIIGKIKHGRLSKPILLGHSFGGQIAAYLAVKCPNQFNKLILSGAAVLRRPNTFKKIFFKTISVCGKFLFRVKLLANHAGLMKKILYRLANSDYNETFGIKREIYKKIIGQDIGNIISRIKLPTLVVWGDRDRYVPIAHGKIIAKLIPGAELKIIKKAGHGLHLKYVREFYEIINKFVSV